MQAAGHKITPQVRALQGAIDLALERHQSCSEVARDLVRASKASPFWCAMAVEFAASDCPAKTDEELLAFAKRVHESALNAHIRFTEALGRFELDAAEALAQRGGAVVEEDDARVAKFVQGIYRDAQAHGLARGVPEPLCQALSREFTN
eukprot:2611173-Pleurochrysis_carterae.AAC.5